MNHCLLYALTFTSAFEKSVINKKVIKYRASLTIEIKTFINTIRFREGSLIKRKLYLF